MLKLFSFNNEFRDGFHFDSTYQQIVPVNIILRLIIVIFYFKLISSENYGKTSFLLWHFKIRFLI